MKIDFTIEKDYGKYKIPEKEFFFLEAIFFCIENIYTSYISLRTDLFNNKNENLVFYVINFIDNAHRLNCIIKKSPSLIEKKKIRKILCNLDKCRDMRNIFQHYDNEIIELIKNIQPLFGHISWIKLIDSSNFEIGLIIPGTMRKFEKLKCINPCGNKIRNIIDQISFFFKNEEINLSNVFYELKELNCFFNEIVKKYSLIEKS